MMVTRYPAAICWFLNSKHRGGDMCLQTFLNYSFKQKPLAKKAHLKPKTIEMLTSTSIPRSNPGGHVVLFCTISIHKPMKNIAQWNLA